MKSTIVIVSPCLFVQIVLAKMGFEPWLKAHGKMRLPDLSKKQALELRECFELIDAGGTGAALARFLCFLGFYAV